MVKAAADTITEMVQRGSPDLDMATSMKAAFETTSAFFTAYATGYRKAWEDERKTAFTRLRDRFKDKQEELKEARLRTPKGKGKGKKGDQTPDKSGAGFNASQVDNGAGAGASSVTETPAKRAAPAVPGASGSNKK
jgi:hypothetical protein